MAWHVAAGDEVTLNQVLVEVETEKAVVELPSPFAGTSSNCWPTPGRRCASARRSSSSTPLPGARTIESVTPATADAKVPMLVGYGPSQAPPSRRRRNGSGHRRHRNGAPSRPAEPRTGRRPPAGPPGLWPRRRSASWHGRTGSTSPTCTGHGPGRDHHARGPGRPSGRRRTAVDPPAPTQAAETRAPVRGVQKHMAEAMVRSVATAPQACVFLTVDVTPTVELVERLRHNRRFEGLRVTPLAVVARAVLSPCGTIRP